jgi:hypothetical protein
MFNEYAEYQLMKLRQKKIEWNSKNAWISYTYNSENKTEPELPFQTNPVTDKCCPCACA